MVYQIQKQLQKIISMSIRVKENKGERTDDGRFTVRISKQYTQYFF